MILDLPPGTGVMFSHKHISNYIILYMLYIIIALSLFTDMNTFLLLLKILRMTSIKNITA